jgi:hypothetical protein
MSEFNLGKTGSLAVTILKSTRGIQKVWAICYSLYSTIGTQEQIYCHF